MDALPDSVHRLAAAALAEMQTDSRHRLPPTRRQAIYDALTAAPEPALHTAPDWLAVLAAQRVLPLFQAQCPDDELPPALLATAIGVLEGRVDNATATELEEQGYQASKNAWGYQEDDLPWPVGLAADAAFHALKEARGHQPLTHLDALLPQATVELQDRPAEPPVTLEPNQPDLDDEALCQMDGSDTASIAAVAAASSEFGPTCDPERLRAFWVWWLQEALPAAMTAARQGHLG